MISIKDRVLIGLIALVTAIAGWLYVSKARVEVEFASFKASVATQVAEGQAKARDAERLLAKTTERLTDELTEKDRLLAARSAAARRSDAGLRDEIARLNARPIPSNPELAAAVEEARTARELLGACSERYTELARQADELRDQVIGLQRFATDICHAGE